MSTKERLSRKELTESLIAILRGWCYGQKEPSGYEPFFAAAHSYASCHKTTWDEAHDCFWVEDSEEPSQEWMDEFEEMCGL